MTSRHISQELPTACGTKVFSQTMFRQVAERCLHTRRPMVCVPLTLLFYKKALESWTAFMDRGGLMTSPLQIRVEMKLRKRFSTNFSVEIICEIHQKNLSLWCHWHPWIGRNHFGLAFITPYHLCWYSESRILLEYDSRTLCAELWEIYLLLWR